MDVSMTNYSHDVNRYLESKLPDVPYHTRAEILEYINNKTCALVNDMIRKRDKEWNDAFRRTNPLYKESLKEKTAALMRHRQIDEAISNVINPKEDSNA